jgi:hypothetical protein
MLACEMQQYALWKWVDADGTFKHISTIISDSLKYSDLFEMIEVL